MSRRSRDRVVLPEDEGPDIPIRMAFGYAIAAEVLVCWEIVIALI